MKKIRLIMQSEEDGANEQVIFTEDLETDIEDFKVSGLIIDSDTIIDNNLPCGFPTESSLLNESYIRERT